METSAIPQSETPESSFGPPTRPVGVQAQAGHLIVGLMVLVTVMLIMLTVTGQSWTFLMRRDAEAEMIFRGEQYMKAIEFYRRENNAFPMELKVLAQEGPHRHRYIRKLYADPLSKDGKWGLLYLSPTGKGYINPYATRRGREQFLAGGFGNQGPGDESRFGLSGRRGSERRRSAFDDDESEEEQTGGYTELTSEEFEARGGEMAGLPIVGVVHKKKETGIKLYRNLASLNDWAFTILAEGEQVQFGGGGAPAVGVPFPGGIGANQEIVSPTAKRDQRKGRSGARSGSKEMFDKFLTDQEREDTKRKHREELEEQSTDQQDEEVEEGEDLEEETGDEEQDPNAQTDPNAPGDPNAPKDPNAPQDPNAPRDPNAPQDPNAPPDPNAPRDPNAPQDPDEPE